MSSRKARSTTGDPYGDPQVVEGNVYPFEESGLVGEPTPTTRRNEHALTETGEIRLAQITDEVRRAAEQSQDEAEAAAYEALGETVAFDAAAVAQALQAEAEAAVEHGKAQTAGVFSDIADAANEIFENATYTPEDIDRQALAAAAEAPEEAAELQAEDAADEVELPKPVLGGAYAAAGQAQDLAAAGLTEVPQDDEDVDLSQFRGKYASLNDISGTHPTIHFDSDGNLDAVGDQPVEQEAGSGFAGYGIVDPSAFEDISEDDVKIHTRGLTSTLIYDDLINWGSRLAQETPLLQRVIATTDAKNICEVGCGSGRHSVLFAQWGKNVIGIDASDEMLERAYAHAAEHAADIEQAGGTVLFKRGTLGGVAKATGPSFCDAIVCMGDLLPKVDRIEVLRDVLDDFANALVPAGILILELSNHIRYEQNRVRTTSPEVFDTAEGTKVLINVMDFPPGSEHIGVDMLTLTCDAEGQWQMRCERNWDLALTPMLIERELLDAGFDIMEMSGDFSGRALDLQTDETMIIVARRKRHRSASQLRREQP